MTHDLIALNFLKTQFSQTTNSSTSKHDFFYMITYESCFTEKVNIYSCERTMKEYVHGLFLIYYTDVNIRLYAAVFLLSRSVRISCLQTELAAIVMEDFIHILQAEVV